MTTAPTKDHPKHVRTQAFQRYVAIGDSSTEGLDDPNDQGGYRGWADRLAEHVARAYGPIEYANFAIRGRHTRQILDEQLQPALALRPDLASVFAGTNDVVSRDFDAGAVGAAIEHMQRAFVAQGATVVTFTMPDLAKVMPAARRLAPKLAAMNDLLRAASAASGAILVDLALHPVAADPRLWSDDRFHANSAGHERIAAALADALDLPGADEGWKTPLPPQRPPHLGQRLAADFGWARRHFVPWLWRHAWGRSSGDGRQPKYPALTQVMPSGR